MFHGPGINFETLRESSEREKLGSKWLYQQSKYVRMSFVRLTISLTFVFLYVGKCCHLARVRTPVC